MWSMLTEEVTLVHECRSLDSMSSSLPRYPRTPRRPRRRARSTPTLDSVVSRVSRSLVSSYDYVLNLSVRSSASYALNKGTRRRRVPPRKLQVLLLVRLVRSDSGSRDNWSFHSKASLWTQTGARGAVMMETFV